MRNYTKGINTRQTWRQPRSQGIDTQEVRVKIKVERKLNLYLESEKKLPVICDTFKERLEDNISDNLCD